MQKIIGGEPGAKDSGVVAKFADLGGGFVHNAQNAVDDANRTAAVVDVAAAAIDLGQHSGILEIEGVIVDQEMETGRVSAPNLKTVEGRQRLMDRQETTPRTAIR